jgi:D-xylose transport system ATP-binding protein
MTVDLRHDSVNGYLRTHEPFLAARGITKVFPGAAALVNVSLTAGRGEIVGIVGENGAGKSTLMKIIAGVYPAGNFEGEVELAGQKLELHDTAAAEAAGIVMIPQELNPVPEMTVAENIFLNREPLRFGVVSTARMNRQAREVLMDFELNIDPTAQMKTLGIARQQLVEIAAALSKKARILILDEPTSALSIHETENLFERLRELRARGVTCLYVSHRLAEVLELADRAFVLRDGRVSGDEPRAKLTHGTIVSMMLGRSIENPYPRKSGPPGDAVLEVKGFTVPYPDQPAKNVVEGVSFHVRSGEILGIFGLMGAGRTELLTALFGAWPVEPLGEVRVHGKRVRLTSPRQAIRAGIALLTEDRKRDGVVATWDVATNISLASLDHVSKVGVVRRRAETALAQYYVQNLAIRTPTLQEAMVNLSGGNQQKVLLGRWLATRPKILLLDEPTRGIDVGAKVEVFQLLNRLTNDGLAVVFVSSELPEILGMSDRIAVMCNGRITGEFQRGEATEEVVLLRATGGV